LRASTDFKTGSNPSTSLRAGGLQSTEPGSENKKAHRWAIFMATSVSRRSSIFFAR